MLIASCGWNARNAPAADVPPAAESAAPVPHGSPAQSPNAPRPRVCVVLSGGGARGMAHIGVLKVLEALKVPIDCIAGTSMGAVVGGLYSSGLSATEIAKVANSLN